MNEFQKLIESNSDKVDLCVELTTVRVAELIAKHLERQNISRGEFARMMEVTPGRVSQILDPDSNLQLRTIARALAVLGLVMDVDAVPIESFSCSEKWVEASSLQTQIASSNSPLTAVFEKNRSKKQYALAA